MHRDLIAGSEGILTPRPSSRAVHIESGTRSPGIHVNCGCSLRDQNVCDLHGQSVAIVDFRLTAIPRAQTVTLELLVLSYEKQFQRLQETQSDQKVDRQLHPPCHLKLGTVYEDYRKQSASDIGETGESYCNASLASMLHNQLHVERSHTYYHNCNAYRYMRLVAATWNSRVPRLLDWDALKSEEEDERQTRDDDGEDQDSSNEEAKSLRGVPKRLQGKQTHRDLDEAEGSCVYDFRYDLPFP